jgi:protein SCO1/2
MFRTVFLKNSLLATFIFLAACSENQQEQTLPYYNTPEFTPVFLNSSKDINQKITHTIGNFSFTNQDNQTITEQRIEGKIHVANFIFTSCGSICPVMTKQMKLVEKTFLSDSNLVILSYSVTPWIDSVSRLKKYANANKIEKSNWHLLTGKKNEIYTLARQSYFAEEDLGFTKDSSQFLHTEHVLLVDKTKRIRGIYNGTLQLEMEQLIKDIQKLKEEK